jgi:hypothetical protein
MRSISRSSCCGINSTSSLAARHDRPISPRCPWQNVDVQRLIGATRRECVDHLVAFNEWTFVGGLATYVRYYKGACTHRSLNQDTPFGRLVQRVGTITNVPHWADCTIRSSEFDFGKAQEELKWNPITILCWA